MQELRRRPQQRTDDDGGRYCRRITHTPTALCDGTRGDRSQNLRKPAEQFVVLSGHTVWKASAAGRLARDYRRDKGFQHARISLDDDSEYREFVALVEAHGSTLWALLRRLCRNEQDAEDAFQETAVRVWRNSSNRPVLRNPRGWLLTVGYRAFLDQKQRVKVHEAIADLPDFDADAPPEQAIRNEETSRVRAALERLPELHRQVLTLHYVGGLSLRQTAEAMGVPEGTVKSRLHAGLNQIRRILE